MASERQRKREERKEKIRQAYAQSHDDLIVIPANPDLVPKSDIREQHLRVAPYCRVSTQNIDQAESIETQKQQYIKMVNEQPNWTLVKVYYDDGRSGTSTRRRDDFKNLIADCRAGKIDMVITKAVARFARNVVDCVSYVRELRNLDPPVGVFFEELGMNTLGQTGDMLVAIMGAVAQAESESKSIAVSWGFRSRFAQGWPKWSATFGYDKKDEDTVVIVEDEARIVRQIYQQYLNGLSYSAIAKILSAASVQTYHGKTIWSPTVVRYILKNEKYCGDAEMQKTIRIDLFSHKTIPNIGQLPKYKKPNVFPAIIDREMWRQVQSIMKMREEMPPCMLIPSEMSGFEQVIFKGRI